jgi:hypothetical protein
MEVLIVESNIAIKETLKQSIIEMQLIRSGKLPKKSWKDLIMDIEEEEDLGIEI